MNGTAEGSASLSSVMFEIAVGGKCIVAENVAGADVKECAVKSYIGNHPLIRIISLFNEPHTLAPLISHTFNFVRGNV